MPVSKTALVTGADGFIGSHLVQLLLEKGYRVKAFCIYNSFGSLGWLDTISDEEKSNIEFILGDIRDPNSIRAAMKNVDIVFHLAALIAIPYSYTAPASYVQTNISGSLNIFQAARDLDIGRVVHTSTSEVYGTAQFVPISEKHPINAQSPYAATKVAADQLALSFWKSFKTPITVLRPFNTYGPRQSARAVIPTVISQIASGKKSIQLGSITPTRDFNFVSDTCSAFEAIANCDSALGLVVNTASNFEVSIGKTVELISQVMNADVHIETDTSRLRPEDSEVNRLFGDNSLMRKLTDWKPQFGGLVGFEKGLSLTATWFANPDNLKYYNPTIYSV